MRVLVGVLMCGLVGQAADNPVLDALLKKPTVQVWRDGKLPGAPLVKIGFQKVPPTAAELAELGKLPHLREVIVTGPLLDDQVMGGLAAAGLLHKAYPATAANYQRATKPEEVTHFHGESIRFDAAGVKHLASLKNLRLLELTGTRITDAGVRAIAQLEGLEELSLDHTTVSAAPLLEIQALKKLHTLGIAEPALSEAGIAALSKFPALKTVRVTTSDEVLWRMKRANLLHLLSRASGEAQSRAASDDKVRAMDLTGRSPSAQALAALTGLPELESVRFAAHQALKDDIAEAFGKLATLREVVLYAGEFSEAGWKRLAALPKLDRLSVQLSNLDDAKLKLFLGHKGMRQLNLNWTRLTAAGVCELKAFPDLESLSLERVPLDEAAAAVLGGLKKLERLDLSSPTVDDAVAAKLVGCTKLQTLNLLGTAVTPTGLQALAPLNKTLTRLTPPLRPIDDATLDAVARSGLLHTLPPFTAGKDAATRGPDDITEITDFRTDFTDASYRHLAAFKNVRQVLVSGSPRLTEACLKTIGTFAKLETLTVARRPVTPAGLKELAGCKELRKLVLSNTKLTDDALAELAGFANLRDLNLLGCPIRGAGLKHLAKLPALQTLSLAGTALDDDGLAVLSELKQLETLNLLGTKVSPEAVATLRKALPGCQIQGPGRGP